MKLYHLINIKNNKNILRARRFVADNNKEVVVMVSILPEKAEAILTIPGNKKYKSLCNRTVKLPNNTWKYTANSISYDVLIEE